MNPHESSPSKLLNVPEAAAYLGLKVHTLRSWVSERKITNVKMGRRVLFRQKDLDELIERSVRPAREDVAPWDMFNSSRKKSRKAFP